MATVFFIFIPVLCRFYISTGLLYYPDESKKSSYLVYNIMAGNAREYL